MSEQTKAALEAAITAHIADECDGDLATAWVMIAETTNIEDMDNNMSAFYIDTRETQSTYTTDGMLYHALTRGTHDQLCVPALHQPIHVSVGRIHL